MAIEIAYEKYSGSVYTVELGATAESGGTRSNIIKVGGQSAFPFMFEEGDTPNPPVVGLEILDCPPQDWPDGLKDEFGDSFNDPIKWAKRCVSEFGSKILCVRLMSVHPDWGARPVNDAVAFLKSLLKEVNVPLIITGCGDAEKDNDLLAKASQVAKNERCLFGVATQNSYKTLTASCLADGHSIIAESPVDVNIAKQVNILISDMGLDPKRIVMHPTTASLGYGLEYVYSIMERARLAAFSGDRMLAMPFILFIGEEVWRVKEAKESPSLGVKWEIATATTMLHSGADILVMRHPKAATEVAKFLSTLMKK
ncbi:MAG: acetyl-CoA decarbonylase/synthase complex subunit delta [Candidatus Omnitrophica bacterium]|nr:acetyl-CoA decarbonylase/synthase complex subunit delta [Candidatus Omnitrophota bacterium]MBI5143875.1 acetyl-CoA decarbonylase/synthase complex subunit delta [Candidatus Omnitrophota bacterium]